MYKRNANRNYRDRTRKVYVSKWSHYISIHEKHLKCLVNTWTLFKLLITCMCEKVMQIKSNVYFFVVYRKKVKYIALNNMWKQKLINSFTNNRLVKSWKESCYNQIRSSIEGIFEFIISHLCSNGSFAKRLKANSTKLFGKSSKIHQQNSNFCIFMFYGLFIATIFASFCYVENVLIIL